MSRPTIHKEEFSSGCYIQYRQQPRHHSPGQFHTTTVGELFNPKGEFLDIRSGPRAKVREELFAIQQHWLQRNPETAILTFIHPKEAK